MKQPEAFLLIKQPDGREVRMKRTPVSFQNVYNGTFINVFVSDINIQNLDHAIDADVIEVGTLGGNTKMIGPGQ